MSPPLPITEDTPPDMLAGAMDLHVVLPNGQDMKMSVERSTPMMDLLVQVTTANKISPGGHVIQAIGDRGILPYKPSTPIGALDTWTIHIVSKKQAGNMYARKPLPRPVNQSTPFEQTFRLQVNLPRNQLYVSRVSYKVRLEDVLREVCREKNLDQSKYCFIHPEKLDEELDLSKTFLHYKLQQITLISKSNRPVGLSSADIMALKRYDNDSQHVNNQYYASHSYDGSISSGSIEGRSLSPVRSDESSGSPTIPKTTTILGRPLRKRRPAPKPPSSVQNGERNSKHGTATETLTISHSRNSSDSSGYHESSVLSESPESNSNSLANSLPRRSKLPSGEPHVSELTTHPRPRSSKYTNGKIGNNLSRSLSNLAVIGNRKANMLSNGMKHKEYSTSSTSLASIPGKKKKAPAPPPPAVAKSLLSLKEEETSLSDYPATVQVPEETLQKSRTLPTIVKLSDVSVPSSGSSRLHEHDSTPSKNSCPSLAIDDTSRHRVEPHLSTDEVDSATAPVIDFAVNSQSVRPEKSKDELTMDDDEIDRIFSDATKDYESTLLPTTESSSETCTNNHTTNNNNCATSTDDRIENPSYHWEYKLPSPPKAFRDNECDLTTAPTRNIPSTNEIVEERKSSAEPTNSSVLKCDSVAENVKRTVSVSSQPKRSGSSGTGTMVNGDGCDPAKVRTTITNIGHLHDDAERAARICKEATIAVEESRSRTLRCDQSAFDTSNCDTYMSTNDSGLGSDDSIPSMSEGRCGMEEACYTTVSAGGHAKNERCTQVKLPERRNTLQNFTITTYQHSNSKPTEIFHDDSVKTSKTTLLAQNKHPFVRPPDENGTTTTTAAAAGLSRHSSFSTEKATNSMVKRSKSHISLLSGNFTKFSRLNKMNGARSYSEEGPSAVSASTENLSYYGDELKATNGCASSHLRRSTSEDGVNKDCVMEEECAEWEENGSRTVVLDTMKKVEELQSVQVLKGILPQINRSQPQPHQTHIPATSATKTAPAEQTVSSVNRNSVTIRTRPSSVHQPAVNLQSWNERPKRQVSIKTDRDYVVGNHRRVSDGDSRDTTTTADRASSTLVNRDCRVESADRVPIVRAVEFKKPFVQQSSVTDVPKCSPQQRPKDVVKPKQRPSSSYLFGEHMTTTNEENVPRTNNTFENEIHNLRNASSSSSAAKRYSAGSINDLAHETSNNSRVENYTFKTYKNKYGVGSNGRRSENGVSTTFVNGECKSNNQNFVVEQNVGKCAYKTFNASSPKDGGAIVTMKSVVAVPPAPVPPPPSSYLRSTTTSQKCGSSQRTSTFIANEDPRDTLLASIKNFNRDNLKKLRA